MLSSQFHDDFRLPPLWMFWMSGAKLSKTKMKEAWSRVTNSKLLSVTKLSATSSYINAKCPSFETILAHLVQLIP